MLRETSGEDKDKVENEEESDLENTEEKETRKS